MKTAQYSVQVILTGYFLQVIDRINDSGVGAPGDHHQAFIFNPGRQGHVIVKRIGCPFPIDMGLQLRGTGFEFKRPVSRFRKPTTNPRPSWSVRKKR